MSDYKLLVKFLIVGCVNTAISFFLFLILLKFMPYQSAFILCYMVGIIGSYVLNGIWTFSSKISVKGLFSYPVVYLIQLFIGWIVLQMVVETFNFSEKIAFIISLLVSIPVGYLMTKFFFKNRHQENSC